MSESSFVSLRWLFQSDEVVPITGFDSFAEVRTGSIRPRASDVGEHRLRYRSITRRRLAVGAQLVATGASYVEAPKKSDSITSDGSIWSHKGVSDLGVLIQWGKGFARYEVESQGDAIPGVEIRAQIRTSSPLEKPLRAAGYFQLA